jgi:hypothetical protein
MPRIVPVTVPNDTAGKTPNITPSPTSHAYTAGAVVPGLTSPIGEGMIGTINKRNMSPTIYNAENTRPVLAPNSAPVTLKSLRFRFITSFFRSWIFLDHRSLTDYISRA